MNQWYQLYLCIIGFSRIEAEHPRETFRDIQFSLKIFLSRALWSLTAKELFPRFEKLFFLPLKLDDATRKLIFRKVAPLC